MWPEQTISQTFAALAKPGGLRSMHELGVHAFQVQPLFGNCIRD